MTRTSHVLAAAVVGLAAAGAFAQDGLYVGGSLGGSHWKGGPSDGFASDDHADGGGKVFGGFSFTPNIAVEAGYADLGKFHGTNGNLSADGYFLDGVGTVPIGQGLSALGRVGVFDGKLHAGGPLASDSDRGTGAKVGLGLQYDLNRQLAVRTEWERYRFDALSFKGNTDLYSVGLNYRF